MADLQFDPKTGEPMNVKFDDKGNPYSEMRNTGFLPKVSMPDWAHVNVEMPNWASVSPAGFVPGSNVGEGKLPPMGSTEQIKQTADSLKKAPNEIYTSVKNNKDKIKELVKQESLPTLAGLLAANMFAPEAGVPLTLAKLGIMGLAGGSGALAGRVATNEFRNKPSLSEGALPAFASGALIPLIGPAAGATGTAFAKSVGKIMPSAFKDSIQMIGDKIGSLAAETPTLRVGGRAALLRPELNNVANPKYGLASKLANSLVEAKNLMSGVSKNEVGREAIGVAGVDDLLTKLNATGKVKQLGKDMSNSAKENTKNWLGVK